MERLEELPTSAKETRLLGREMGSEVGDSHGESSGDGEDEKSVWNGAPADMRNCTTHSPGGTRAGGCHNERVGNRRRNLTHTTPHTDPTAGIQGQIVTSVVWCANVLGLTRFVSFRLCTAPDRCVFACS